MNGLLGRVKFFNEEKGFGFIVRDDGAGDVFLHIHELRKCGLQSVAQNDRLKFDLADTDRGKRAVNIKREG